ncbi:hypothetical protein SLS60_008315 [Paraconiothyrium brasiliense]|uniref:Nephrocystin 3-like N-terminal domain-containing protein n=1 Tax=Paraconiothyrium brasiliense TaxID=300254 RepID=A0ABR3R0L5_9PLEO
MAEVIGVVASVAQLVHLSGTLLAGGYGFLAKVTRAPTEIRSLLTETAAINSLLGQLQDVTGSTSKVTPDDALQALQRTGVFEECTETLKVVEKVLAKFNSARALKRIEIGQESLNEKVDHLTATADTQMDAAEAEKIISWVCPLPSDGAYASLDNALSRRLPGTGTWFIESDIFREWVSSATPSTIWITGLPGSGKTILCSSIIEHVREAVPPVIPTIFFFCDHRDSQKQTLDNFVMSILRQLLGHSTAALEHAKDMYKKNHFSRKSSPAERTPLLEELLAFTKESFIVVDGLDESTEGDAIADLLTMIVDRAESRGHCLRLLFSRRFDVNFEKRHKRISSRRLALADNTRPDIEQYIQAQLADRLERGLIKVRDRALLSDMEQRIGSRAGTMLQARLQLDYLSTAKTDRALKLMLQNLPNGLEYTYESLLRATVFRFPNRLSEMLALQPGDTYLDPDAITTDPYDALETIAPLVVIDGEVWNYETVKLCHYSLREYLCSSPLRHAGHQFHVNQQEAHSWLSLLCLQYLTVSLQFDLSDMERKLNPGPTETHHFLSYAALCWHYHMGAASSHPGYFARIKPYLDNSANNVPGTSSWFSRAQDIFRDTNPDHDAALHSLVCFAIFADLKEVTSYLLSKMADLDHHFPDGYTVLTSAARWDQPHIVRKLLQMGASIDVPTAERKLTPLHLAAEHACEEVVDTLLDAGADPHARSTSLTTPFYRAARSGNVHILTRLKDAGCDVNARTYDDWTPLHEAVGLGHTEAIELLVEWGADITATTDDGFVAAPDEYL